MASEKFPSASVSTSSILKVTAVFKMDNQQGPTV